MSNHTIDLLRDEACRLLQVEIDLLQRMQAAHGVVVDDHANEHQTFSRQGVHAEIDVLKGELQKVSELRMVLAVVGTMKAGKSTTINAIVGNEVLPNRNRPMTALPTLIEHTPGQLQPVLHLNNVKPISQLMAQLSERVETPEGKAGLQSLEQTNDMNELLRLIYARGRFKDQYEGSEDIFWFLKSLNDLVRLAAALDVEFPFASYAGIDDYPVIKVQFAHLGQDSGQGRLALLDTPGPNEAGQQHLRKMLREQLKKASAVLAVMDFTQLKSDADEQVREYLEEVSEVSKGRLFILVNKFDQRDRNGDTAEQTSSFVAESLLKRRVQPSDVYPVSSRLGYLASRAQQELAQHRRLPEPHSVHNAWVEDFGKDALGFGWKNKLENYEMLKCAADELWEHSLFVKPLNNVIRKANDQAAVIAISAAAAKLAHTAKRLKTFLEVRNTALAISAGELQRQTDELLKDLKRIDQLGQKSKVNSERALNDIRREMKVNFNTISTEIKQEIEAGFKAGKQQEQQAVARNQNASSTLPAPVSAKWLLDDLFSALTGKPSRRTKTGFGHEFDPSSPVINFDSAREAKQLIEDIEKGVQGIIADGEAVLLARMNNILKRFRSTFAVEIESTANLIINELNLRMNRNGFAIELEAPATAPLSLSYSAGEVLRDAVDSKQRKVTRSRRSKGTWGTICSWFNSDDWGWETYTVKQSYYTVDIDKLRATVNQSIDTLFQGLDTAATETIEKPLKENLDAFFVQLVGSIEAIRSDLLQSVRDQEHSQAEQQVLGRLLEGFKRDVVPLQKDSDGLLADIEPLSGEVAV